jgi:photosystem II stability/assembly factor-like uncharacterized protein
MWPPSKSLIVWLVLTTRIAGAFFEPADSDADIAGQLDDLVAQNVSVIIADCPLGWSYSAWVDDPEFQQNLALVQRVTTATPTPTSIAGWEPAGFGGAGNFDGVFFDPNQSGVVYAASDVAGVFRSTDYGDHWQMRSVGLGNYEVSSFAVDPFDSNTLYAGTGAFTQSNKSGIYVSHDAGLTLRAEPQGEAWQHLTSTFTHRITFRRFRTADAIAPDPAEQGVILSGSRDNGVWRSTDGGLSWTQVYPAPLTSAPLTTPALAEDDPTTVSYPAPVSVVVFDPTNPNVVYAGLDGAGVVKSTARGVAGSWQPINNGLPVEAKIKYLAVSGGGVLYAAVDTNGVYKSTNGGGQWQPANGSLPLTDAWVSSVAVHPTDPAIVYLTLVTYDYPSVWKTTDGGVTWVAKGDVTYDAVNDPTRVWAAGPTWSWQVTLDRANPNRLFFVDFWGIQRSDDSGEHWAEKIVGAQNTCVTSLAVDTDHPVGQPDTLYATHMDAGLLASTDNGATWTMVLPRTWDGTLTGHYWRFAVARVGNTKYYYTTVDPWSQSRSKVLRSTDGVNWTTVFNRPRPTGAYLSGALGLAVDPSQPSTLYVTQDGGQVFKSTDNGNTWAPTPGQPGGASFTYALAVDSAGRVFAGTLVDGLWRSTDGGVSWQRVLSEQSTIFHVLAVPGAVYAPAGDANLYRSTDGGTTWQRLTSFSSVDDGDGVGDQGMAIAVDPNDPAHLLFSWSDTWHWADASPGIVESLDGGATWAPLNTGLGHLKVSALAFGQAGTLFAGTSCGGVWRLRPGIGVTPTATPTPTVTPSPAPTGEVVVDKWALWTGGTHLRGANIYQRRVYPELDGPDFMGPGPVGPPYTQADFNRLAAMGANYVNISHPGLFTETLPYALDPRIRDNLDHLLDTIAQADLFAVISFRTGPGRSEFTFFWDEVGTWFDESYLNDSMWQDQAAQDAWVDMWRYTAERYRDNPIVVGYDLMVEPNSNEVGSHALNDRLDIWDPEEFYSRYRGTLYDWNQLYPRITAAIRQVDPDTPILIGGMAYSAVGWLPYLQPTGDPRTVYTVHQYAPTVYTHQVPPLTNTYPGVFDTDWDDVDDQFNRTWLENLLSTVDTFTATHGVPVAVNEFGVMRWEPGVADFMDDQIDLFERRGMNHALWVWDPAWEPLAENDAFNFRHGPDPNNHTDVQTSDLIQVITGYWGRNTLRPSSSAICPDFVNPPGVGVEDIQTVTARWLMTRADPNWDPRYDRDADGDIDIVDIMQVAARWGERCQDTGS